VNADEWQELRRRLDDAEKRRDYESCALLSLALSDEAESVDISHVWVAQAQVYATLSITRQMQREGGL
jgi:hypothetical protein